MTSSLAHEQEWVGCCSQMFCFVDTLCLAHLALLNHVGGIKEKGGGRKKKQKKWERKLS